jgi:hypothetical protein
MVPLPRDAGANRMSSSHELVHPTPYTLNPRDPYVARDRLPESEALCGSKDISAAIWRQTIIERVVETPFLD